MIDYSTDRVSFMNETDFLFMSDYVAKDTSHKVVMQHFRQYLRDNKHLREGADGIASPMLIPSYKSICEFFAGDLVMPEFHNTLSSMNFYTTDSELDYAYVTPLVEPTEP